MQFLRNSASPEVFHTVVFSPGSCYIVGQTYSCVKSRQKLSQKSLKGEANLIYNIPEFSRVVIPSPSISIFS